MKKFVLIYPNQLWQKIDPATNWFLNPATLCLLAAFVKEYVEVKIIDANFYNISKEEFKKSIAEFKPDYAGISVLTSEYGKTLDITASILKEVNPDIIVIAGGIHPTIEYEEVIKNMDIDYIIRGEGEFVLINLLKYLNGNGEIPQEGLVYRKDDNIVVTSQVYLDSIEHHPWPDYSYINLHDYLKVENRISPLSAPEHPFYRLTVSRGCPFGCSFCQVETISGKTIRTRDPIDVVNHLIEIKEKYGIRSLVFDDDNLLGNMDFFKKMLETLVEKNINLPFIMSSLAVFLLTDEILDLMVKAGCKALNIAVESGNKRILKDVIRKPLELDIVPEAIQKIRSKGIFCLANFIIGFPGESWDEVLNTVKYAEDCGADYVKIFFAVPLKRTKLWEMTKSMNAYDGDIDKSEVNWRFSKIKSDEWTPKDISIIRAYEWDRINFGTAEKRELMKKIWQLSEEDLRIMRKKTRDAITIV